MIIEISLVIIAIALVTLVSVLIVTLSNFRKALSTLQGDLHDLSVETTSLVVKLNELTSDLTRKSQSFNFLLKPLSFFNKANLLKSDSDSSKSTQESSFVKETIPQLIEWIATSLILVKKTKEFIKHYAK